MKLDELELRHTNPRVGKNKIVIGKLLRYGGIGMIIGGGVGWLNSQAGFDSNSNEKDIMNMLTMNYEFFLKGGVGSYITGWIFEGLGRFQHWRENKTYYR